MEKRDSYHGYQAGLQRIADWFTVQA